MKKRCALLSVILVIFFAFGFSNAMAKPEIEMNYADWNPPQANITQITLAMIDRMEKNSNGRIKINTYLSSALLKQSEVYRGVQKGLADFAYFGPNVPGSPVRMGDLISLPFLGISNHEMTGVVYEKLFRSSPDLQGEYKGVLVKGIFGIPNDNLHFKNRAVHVPADMKGMKLLTVGTRTNYVRALGGVPVMIDPGEWYMSLDKGLVEGMYFLTPVIGVFKLESQFNYHTVIDSSATVNMFIYNEKKWNQLPKDLQAVMDEAFRWRVTEIDKFHYEDEAQIYKTLKDMGHEIYHPTADEMKLWADAAIPVQKAWIEDAEKKGFPAQKVFNQLMETIADVKSTWKK